MKSTYVLELKPYDDNVRGEQVNQCTAYSLTEAVNIFSQTKQLRPDQLLKIFSVYEQSTNGE